MTIVFSLLWSVVGILWKVLTIVTKRLWGRVVLPIKKIDVYLVHLLRHLKFLCTWFLSFYEWKRKKVLSVVMPLSLIIPIILFLPLFFFVSCVQESFFVLQMNIFIYCFSFCSDPKTFIFQCLSAGKWASSVQCGAVGHCSFTLYWSSKTLYPKWTNYWIIKAVIVCPERAWTAIYTCLHISCSFLVHHSYPSGVWTWTTIYTETIIIPIEMEKWKRCVLLFFYGKFVSNFSFGKFWVLMFHVQGDCYLYYLTRAWKL